MDVNDARFDDGDEPMEALPDDVLTAMRSVEIDQLARERAITAALAAAPDSAYSVPPPCLGPPRQRSSSSPERRSCSLGERTTRGRDRVHVRRGTGRRRETRDHRHRNSGRRGRRRSR
jgi:hypothetical protein